jgi:hypothetical protein
MPSPSDHLAIGALTGSELAGKVDTSFVRSSLFGDDSG